MTDEQVKAFLIELTRLSRKHGIEIESELEEGYNNNWHARVALGALPESHKIGYYIIDSDGGLVFAKYDIDEFLLRRAGVQAIGQPPEDHAP